MVARKALWLQSRKPRVVCAEPEEVAGDNRDHLVARLSVPVVC